MPLTDVVVTMSRQATVFSLSTMINNEISYKYNAND